MDLQTAAGTRMYFGNGAVTVMTVVWYGKVARGAVRYGTVVVRLVLAGM